MEKENLESEDKNGFLFHKPIDGREINRLYHVYKKPFCFYIRKYFSAIDDSVINDIYTESFVILYKNIKDGKLTKLSSSLFTYLTAIGKNLSFKYIRDKKEYHKVELNDNVFSEIEVSDEQLKKQEITYRTVCEMGEPCNKVLNLYYWEQKSMQEIAKRMNYKNEQVAKNKKRSCVNMLKDKLRKRLQAEGLI